MAHQSPGFFRFPRLRIYFFLVGRYFILLHKCYKGIQNKLILLKLNAAFGRIHYLVASLSIKARNCLARFIHTNRKLSLIPIMHNLFTANYREHRYLFIAKTTYSLYAVKHLLLLELKLCLVRKVLELTASTSL